MHFGADTPRARCRSVAELKTNAQDVVAFRKSTTSISFNKNYLVSTVYSVRIPSFRCIIDESYISLSLV